MRLKELDVLRGLAAVSVVMFHYTTKFREEFGHSFSKVYDWDYGHYGVQLFFVISGFVIFLTLQNVKSIREFAYKRFTRLYPTYWICLIITFTIVSIFGLPGREVPLRDAAIGLTMVQGLFKLPSVDGAYWSLLPELLFYFFMGTLFYLKKLNRIRVIGIFWLLLMVINSIVKIPIGNVLLNLNYGMFFLAGILYFRIKYRIHDMYDHVLILFCFLAAGIADRSLESQLVNLAIFSLFYLFVYDKLNFLSNKIFLFLGFVSYPLYLLHQNVGFVVMRSLKAHHIEVSYLIVVLVMLAVIFIAWIVTAYVEKPIMSALRHKDKVRIRNIAPVEAAKDWISS